MKTPIFLLGSSFEEVQDRSKDHLDPMSRTFILNLFLILSKYVQVGLKVLHPQQMCHTPLMIGIYRVNVGAFSTHLNTHLLLLYEHLRSKKDEVYRSKKDEIYCSQKSAIRVSEEV